MRNSTWNSVCRPTVGLLAAALMLAGASSAAQAAVLISSGATTNIACVSGVCTPTKKGAILNVTQLETLLASGNVKVTTDGSKASDIFISANLNWASANSLTLDAYQSITIDNAVLVNGTGALTLTTNDGGTGGMLSFGAKGRVAFLSTANSLTINGAVYTLVADTTTLASDIASNPSGDFALAENYNASSNPTYVTTTFNGNFEGLGNTISNLTIMSANASVGLFASSGGTIANVRLTKAKITIGKQAPAGAWGGLLVGANSGSLEGDSVNGTIRGNGTVWMGGLVGYNPGAVIESDSAAKIVVTDPSEFPDSSFVGGLVGFNAGSITSSHAMGAATSTGGDFIGGLVGANFSGTVANSYAAGTVSSGESIAGRNPVEGGLVAINDSSITSSYSTTSVTGVGGAVGGLVGSEGPEHPDASCYWDMTTSGITNPSQGAGSPSNDPGITGLSNTQLQAGLPAGFSSTIWGENPGINGGLPYLLALPPPG